MRSVDIRTVTVTHQIIIRREMGLHHRLIILVVVFVFLVHIMVAQPSSDDGPPKESIDHHVTDSKLFTGKFHCVVFIMQ
jgi:hypothetical protein